MPSNLPGIIYPIPNFDIGWGATLNNNTTIIDNVFAAGGTGTSVGLQVGSTKTLGIGGTLILGGGDGTGTVTAPTIRGAERTGSNVVGANLTIDAANGTGTGGSGALIFRTFPPGAGGMTPNSPQNSLVINSAGYVGIGTSSPTALLDINSATTSDMRLSVSGSTKANFYATTAEAVLLTVPSIPLTFGTNNTERLRIGTAGQIGIAGANYGTANQVLTSNGPSASVSWKDPGIASLTSQIFAAPGNSFTGIPAWAKSITMTVAGMDPSSSYDVLVRVGTSAGFVTTGYSSSGTSLAASTLTTVNETTGFLINISGSIGSGTIRLIFVNGFTWSCDHVIGTTTQRTCVGGGSVTLPAALDRVQIIPSSIGTFATSGAVTVMYQ